MSRIWSAEHSNHEKAIIFFYSTLHLTYYSLFSPTSECAKYTFEWLFRHRKFRIVLRGNLIKHKPALHNSLISEEWCAAIVISKKDKPKYYYKLKADKFKLFAYTTTTYVSSANSKLFSIIFMLQCINKLSKTIQFYK